MKKYIEPISMYSLTDQFERDGEYTAGIYLHEDIIKTLEAVKGEKVLDPLNIDMAEIHKIEDKISYSESEISDLEELKRINKNRFIKK